jgi:hypothetical protein
MRPAADNAPGGQLDLPFGLDAEALGDQIRSALGRPVSLAITDNSSSLFSVRDRGATVLVRIHRMFLRAGRDVIAEITRYIARRSGGTPLFWSFVKRNRHMIKSSPSRNRRLRTGGAHHDLAELFSRLNSEYFGGRLGCAITWGRRSPRRAARTRTLGSYCSDTGIITINTALDRKAVPRYYVGFVVYHEMLHAGLGHERVNGRRRIHSPEFRHRERLYRDFARASAWERKNRA